MMFYAFVNGWYGSSMALLVTCLAPDMLNLPMLFVLSTAIGIVQSRYCGKVWVQFDHQLRVLLVLGLLTSLVLPMLLITSDYFDSTIAPIVYFSSTIVLWLIAIRVMCTSHERERTRGERGV